MADWGPAGWSGGSNGSTKWGPSAGGGGKKKHGVLATLEHVATQTPKDIYHMAVNAPAGLYQVAKAPVEDTIDFVKHPWSQGTHHTLDVGKAVLKSTEETVKHPLRHPGYTLATVLPVGEAAARGAEAGAAIRAGEGAGEAAARLVGRGKHPAVAIKHEGVTAKLPTPRSALGRAGQKARVRVSEAAQESTAPSLKPVRAVAKGAAARRVGGELKTTRVIREHIERGPAVGLMAGTKKLPLDQQTALRTVAEGVKTDERIAHHKAQAAKAKSAAERKRHAEKIQVLQKSKQHLIETGPVPKLKPGPLKKVYEDTAKVAKSREDFLARIGKITPQAAQGRISAPGQLIVHGEENLVKAPSGQVSVRVPGEQSIYPLQRDLEQTRTVLRGEQRRLATLERALRKPPKSGGKIRARPMLQKRVAKQRAVVTEWKGKAAEAQRTLETKGPRLEPAFSGGEFRVPYTYKNGLRSLERQARGPVTPPGQPRLPGSLTHEYKGELLKTGNFRDDTTRLVGESALEAQRLGSAIRLRDQIKQAAKPEPMSKHDVPMRLDNLKPGGLTPEEQQLLERTKSGEFSYADQEAFANLSNKIREHVFPHQRRGPLSNTEREAFQQLAQQEKIGWVDRRLLAKMDQPVPSLQSVVGKHPASFVDAVNNASRVAIFYAKPAYPLPNIIGNAALTIIQQGFAAPVNLARSVLLNRYLSPEVAARIDDLMGEGVARAISSQSGVGSQVVNKLAGGWSKLIDTPFRRAGFLYEAQRAGFKTPEQVTALIENEAHREALVPVVRRANAAMIDYAGLTPREREYIRRIVFVYPWIKGSTKYAGHFVREHPIQAGIQGQLGVTGYQQYQKEFPGAPSWFEGSIRVGGSDATPKVVNPSAAAIFQTPAQVGAALAAAVTGHPSRVAEAAGFGTPGAQFLSDILHQRGVKHAIAQRFTTTPQYRLATGGAPSQVYKGSPAGQFLIGGFSSRTVDRAELTKSGAKEHAKMHPSHRKKTSGWGPKP